jgi:hypothetical protein
LAASQVTVSQRDYENNDVPNNSQGEIYCSLEYRERFTAVWNTGRDLLQFGIQGEITAVWSTGRDLLQFGIQGEIYCNLEYRERLTAVWSTGRDLLQFGIQEEIYCSLEYRQRFTAVWSTNNLHMLRFVVFWVTAPCSVVGGHRRFCSPEYG